MEERHELDGRKGRNFSARWWSRETIVGAALGPIGGEALDGPASISYYLGFSFIAPGARTTNFLPSNLRDSYALK